MGYFKTYTRKCIVIKIKQLFLMYLNEVRRFWSSFQTTVQYLYQCILYRKHKLQNVNHVVKDNVKRVCVPDNIIRRL